MSDVLAALVLGCVLWLLGGAGLVVALVISATLFVPFAAVVIGLGVAYCLTGVLWWLGRQNSGPGSARLPAR